MNAEKHTWCAIQPTRRCKIDKSSYYYIPPACNNGEEISEKTGKCIKECIMVRNQRGRCERTYKKKTSTKKKMQQKLAKLLAKPHYED